MKKRTLIRLAIGAMLLLAIGLGVLRGIARYAAGRNPYLPKSSWPVLETAKTASSNDARIFVSEDVQMTPFEEGIEYWECELAADPGDPNLLFAASLVVTPESRPKSCTNAVDVAGYYSHDGGKSWARGFYFVADKATNKPIRESYWDPTVCYGRDGSVHLVVMFTKQPSRYDVDATRRLRKQCVLEFWTSLDRGVTWAKRATVPRYVDRPFTVVATKKDAQSGRQYTIGNIDEVVIYANEEKASEIGSGVVMEREFTNPRPANPVILLDGTVLFAAEDFNPLWEGGFTPGVARQIWTFRCPNGENIVAGSKVNTHWSHESLTHARPSVTMFPRLAANPDSSKFVDRVYCVWAGGRFDGERIFVSVSPDGGGTWDQPVVISEQPLSANHDREYLTALPSVAVNRHGVVAVSWYDRRGLPKSVEIGGGSWRRSDGWNVRARISHDGGVSWLPSVQLNRAQSRGRLDVGHTAGLAAAADGRFHALWVDARDGTRQLRTASFGIEGKMERPRPHSTSSDTITIDH